MRTRRCPLVLLIILAACGGRPSAPAPTPPVEAPRVISADGTQLFVAEAGPRDAQAIVLIHGLGFSHEVWQPQWQSELAARFHLVTYDLRGHGRSARPTDPVAYQDGERWAQDLHAVLTATRATGAQKPILVGWSLGGLVIAHYLRLYGDQSLGGIVLVNAVTKLAPELLGSDNQRYLTGLDSPDDATRAAATHNFLRACFLHPLPPATFERLAAAAGVLPAWEHAAIQQISSDGLEQALRSARVPALILHGTHDVLVAEAMARYSQSLLSSARLVRYEGSGHAPFFDEAARFNAELAALATAPR